MKKISYQEAITEIEEILAEIENEALDVDELTGKVKRAATLIKTCREKLHKTEKDIEQILGDMEEEK